MKPLQSHWRIISKPNEGIALYASVYSISDSKTKELKLVCAIHDESDNVYDVLEQDIPATSTSHIDKLFGEFTSKVSDMISFYSVSYVFRLEWTSQWHFPITGEICECCGNIAVRLANVAWYKFNDTNKKLIPANNPRSVVSSYYNNTTDAKITIAFGSTETGKTYFTGLIWRCGWRCRDLHYRLAYHGADWKEWDVDEGNIVLKWTREELIANIKKVAEKWEKRIVIGGKIFYEGDGTRDSNTPWAWIEEINWNMWSR